MIPVNDFRLYWLAARALLAGHNPYAPTPSYPVFSMRHPGEALVPFNPPWALPIVLPLGWLPYKVGEFAWLALSVLLFGIAAIWILEVYGKTRSTLVAIAVFVPFIFLGIIEGQITAFLLFGLAGFLRYEANRPLLAGMFLFFLAAKPQLVFLLWLALLLGAFVAGQWKSLIGFVAALSSASLLVLILRPGIFADYLRMVRAHHVATYDTRALAWLCAYVYGSAWFQYVPMLLASVWLGWKWNRLQTWKERLPALLAMSLATTPYAWPADYVLLAPAIVYVANRLNSSAAPRTKPAKGEEVGIGIRM